MVFLCSVQNFGYYGVMIWLPNYLSTRFGYGLAQSATWTAVTIAGMAVGIFFFGQAADRIGRRPAFFTYMLGAAIMVLVYSKLTDPFALLIGGAVMGLFVNGMLGGYGALMSELYPTAARATAQNVLFNIGRAVGGFGPVVVSAVAAAYGFDTAIALLALLYLARYRGVLVPDSGPPRRGARLDRANMSCEEVIAPVQLRQRVTLTRRAAAPWTASSRERRIVLSNDSVNAEYRHLVVGCSAASAAAVPGQFFQLLCPHTEGAQPFLRRPMSLYGADPRAPAGRVSL